MCEVTPKMVSVATKRGIYQLYTTLVVEIKSTALWYITDIPRQTVVYN